MPQYTDGLPAVIMTIYFESIDLSAFIPSRVDGNDSNIFSTSRLTISNIRNIYIYIYIP